MFFDRECNDLTPYTNCFSRLDVCYNTTGLQCDQNARYRTLGGTCNNLLNPKLGAQYSAYSRLEAADYHDCWFYAFYLFVFIIVTKFVFFFLLE